MAVFIAFEFGHRFDFQLWRVVQLYNDLSADFRIGFNCLLVLLSIGSLSKTIRLVSENLLY